MKIAICGSVYLPVTTDACGGGEVWTAHFTLEHIKRGQLIDLYAIKNSISQPPNLNLIQLYDRGVEDIKIDYLFLEEKNEEANINIQKLIYTLESRFLVLLKKDEKKFDLIIDSSAKFNIAMNWDLFTKPLIVIGHLPTSNIYVSLFRTIPLPENVFFIFPSQFQTKQAYWIPEEKKFTIPHGLNFHSLNNDKDNNKENIVWVGRIDPNSPKGLDVVLQISKKLNKKTEIFGYISDNEYYKSTLKAISTKNIVIKTEYVEKQTIYSHAKLFLFPIKWDEPFGLVLIEAMATGTPIIAFAKGAVSEIVKDGETGFIVNSSDTDKRGDWIIKKTGIEGLCEAVERIYAMPEEQYKQMRLACRAHVEKNFTVERMVDKYEEVYKKVLEK